MILLYIWSAQKNLNQQQDSGDGYFDIYKTRMTLDYEYFID